MSEEKVFQHGDIISIGSVPSGFIVLEEKKWEEERKRMEYELDVANERANSWCAEYNKQRERAEKAEKKLEELRETGVWFSKKRAEHLERIERLHYENMTGEEERPLGFMFGPNEKTEIPPAQTRFLLHLRALQRLWEEKEEFFAPPPEGSGIRSSQIRALLMYLVKKGVL